MVIPSPEVSTADTARDFVLQYVPPDSDNSYYVQQVLDQIEQIDPGHLVSLEAAAQVSGAVQRLILDNSVGPDGDPVPADVAAEQVVELFDHVRMAPAQDPSEPSSATGQESVSHQEPIGVEVDANVDLSGLRDQAVWLHWSMYTETGGTRLFGKWLGSVVAAQLIPASDHDTGSVSFWIPMPVDPGPYVAKLELFSNGSRLASATTDPFN